MKSDKVAILAKKTSLEFEKLANPLLEKYHLTYAQYKILKYLFSDREKPVRQIDLEKFYSLTHPAAIGLLNQLERKGFIQRQINPDDARSRIISLTEKSLELKDDLIDVGEMLESKLTVALSESERCQLVSLLQRLLSAFE